MLVELVGATASRYALRMPCAATSVSYTHLELSGMGVLLNVCRKNEEAAAKAGFERADSVLKADDFLCFKANCCLLYTSENTRTALPCGCLSIVSVFASGGGIGCMDTRTYTALHANFVVAGAAGTPVGGNIARDGAERAYLHAIGLFPLYNFLL